MESRRGERSGGETGRSSQKMLVIGSSLSQVDIHRSSAEDGDVVASEEDGRAVADDAVGIMARSFSISVSRSSPPKREVISSSEPCNMGRIGDAPEVVVVNSGESGWTGGVARMASDMDDEEGDDGARMKGDEDAAELGDEAATAALLLSMMARSQSSVFACAGEIVVVVVVVAGVAVVVKLQMGRSDVVEEGTTVVSKRPVLKLVPPAAGTSHRPMKGTRRTPPVLGGEWKTMQRHRR